MRVIGIVSQIVSSLSDTTSPRSMLGVSIQALGVVNNYGGRVEMFCDGNNAPPPKCAENFRRPPSNM